MPGEFQINSSHALAFAFVLTRIAGALVFVPLPGIRNSLELGRLVLAVALTLAVYPAWPANIPGEMSLGLIALIMLGEAGFGVAIGLSIAFLLETFVVAAQVFGLQAGYSYASTLDPNSQADTTVLQVFAQLSAALLFISLGLDREVIRIFASSLQSFPPGGYQVTERGARVIIELGSNMFTTGLRLALPIVALLALVDISLALMGRIHAQLQLLTIAFPAKMLLSLVLLALLLSTFPAVFEGTSRRTISALTALVHP